MTLFALIIGLALIQSWFGVGLLVMGTPILLILGNDYTRALWILLPCSITVSALQLATDRGVTRADVRRTAAVAIPALLAGMAINFVYSAELRLGILIAIMLVLAAILRLSPRLAAGVRSAANRHESVWMGIIGLVHGVTNMGGTLLLQLAAARRTDKLGVRQYVALGYVILASAQLVTLYAASGNGFELETIGLAATAASTFLAVGRKSFALFGRRAYSTVLAAFMLAIAAVLVWRS